MHNTNVVSIDQASIRSAAQRRDIIDLAAIVVAVSLVGLVAGHSAGLPRIVMALAFTFFVPGRAIVSNWPRIVYWSEFAMPVVISLAVLTLVATVALWAHAWHPLGLFQIEAGLSVLALGFGMLHRHRGPRGESSRRAQSVLEGNAQ